MTATDDLTGPATRQRQLELRDNLTHLYAAAQTCQLLGRFHVAEQLDALAAEVHTEYQRIATILRPATPPEARPVSDRDVEDAVTLARLRARARARAAVIRSRKYEFTLLDAHTGAVLKTVTRADRSRGLLALEDAIQWLDRTTP